MVPSQGRVHKGRKTAPELQQPAKSKRLPRYVREALEEVAAERKSQQTPQPAAKTADLPPGSSSVPATLSSAAGKAGAPAAVKARRKAKSKVSQ